MVGYAWIKCESHNKGGGHANPPYSAGDYRHSTFLTS